MSLRLLKELPQHKPDFERVRTALLCGQPDRIPLMEVGINAKIMGQLLGRPVMNAKDTVDFYQGAGYDYVMVGILGRNEIGFDDRGLKDSSLKRAAGSREVIENRDDFEKFKWPEWENFNVSFLEKYEKLLPGGMKIILSTGIIFDAAYLLMGFEKLCIASIENPELVRAIIEKISDIALHRLERIIENKSIGAFWLADDIAFGKGLMLKPDFFRRHVFNSYRKITELCRQKNIPLIFHSDGNYREIIPDLIDIGFNAIHPLEPGSMDILEIKQTYGKKLCMIGNIDIGYTLTRGTPEETAIETRKRMKELGSGGGYCVSSSNCITEYVKPENYFAMLDTVLRYGEYPLRFRD